jgi:signal transduction histidine kinase/ActR/RegA family two-component response regulator
MQEVSRLESFAEMLRRLRTPRLIASQNGRIVAANVAAAEALGTSVAALEGTSLERYSPDPSALRQRLDDPRADAPFPLRARDGRRFFCSVDVLAPDILLLRLSGGPEVAYLRGTAAGTPAPETLEELSRALLTHAMHSLRAIAGGIYLLDDAGTNLELKGAVGYTADSLDRFRLIPLSAPMHLTDALKRVTPVFVGSPEEFSERYPEFARTHTQLVSTRAMAAIPLEVGGRVIGIISLGFSPPRSFSERDRDSMCALARQCAEVFDWVQRLQGDGTNAERDERAASRLEQLHAFTRALAQAITPADVAEAVVDMGMAATLARSGGLWLLSDDGTAVSLARSVGPTGPRPEDHVRVSLEPRKPMPILDAIRDGTPVWIESCRQMQEAYPEVFRAFSTGGESALACIPLFAQGRCIGGLAFNFEGSRRFGEEERAFLQVLSWHSAQALERSRLYAAETRAREEAEASQRRSDFLADTGILLASSLDYSSTLASVARAAVPRVADWCIVELQELKQRGLPPVVTHVDPAKQPLVLEFATRLRALIAREPEMRSVLRSGKPQLRRNLSMEQLREWVCRDAALCDLFERIGIVSSMVVPVSVRGRTQGVVVLNSGQAARLYDENDLAMAEELGRRAGLAVENARLYRDAREADRQKDEFLAMLSHELRNPLTPIVSALEVMKVRGGDAFAKERTIIHRHVQHVVRLVNDLLDVARVTRGKIELRREPCELSSVVAKAVEMASPLVEERRQHLTASAPAGLAVMADSARLAQAISNLLANAAKYTEPGGHIGIVAQAEGSDAVVRVRDSGIGIEPEALPRVFDLFVQEKRALDRAQGGLGIGLTVVKSLVDLHGGSVAAHSKGRGKGSEFVIRLPLASVDHPGASVPEAPPSSPTLGSSSAEGRLRVLVVDDNTDAADMLREALRVLGCSVQVAHDGEAALAVASDFSPDLALVDIGLPVMNGYELVAHLRRLDTAPKRIVAVTGYGQEADYLRSRDAGFDEHVVKPIDLGKLQEVLERSRHAMAGGAPA